MVEYTDITKYASKAYLTALMENEQAARQAAINAVEELGLNHHIAQEVASEVATKYQTSQELAQKKF